MIRLAVLGSCVSAAPAYEVTKGKIGTVCYHKQTSFVSLDSSPIAISEDALPWPSLFAKKAVLADFRKTILESIAASQPDAILFDFIDERYNLLKTGDSYVVRSEPLIDSGFPGGLPLDFEVVERFTESTEALWRRSCTRIAQRLRSLCPRTCFLLHRCWLSNEYWDSDGIHSFSLERQAKNTKINSMLASYYDHFAKFPGLRTVEVFANNRGFAQHKWGLAPCHFEPEYGEHLMRQVLECVTAANEH